MDMNDIKTEKILQMAESSATCWNLLKKLISLYFQENTKKGRNMEGEFEIFYIPEN